MNIEKLLQDGRLIPIESEDEHGIIFITGFRRKDTSRKAGDDMTLKEKQFARFSPKFAEFAQAEPLKAREVLEGLGIAVPAMLQDGTPDGTAAATPEEQEAVGNIIGLYLVSKAPGGPAYLTSVTAPDSGFLQVGVAPREGIDLNSDTVKHPNLAAAFKALSKAAYTAGVINE